MRNSTSFVSGHPYYPSSIKGRKQSPEHKRKRSLSMLGKNKGKKRSLAFRLNLSSRFSGSSSPLWRGGVWQGNKIIRKRIEYRLWREAVFARDCWTCQKTGIIGGKIEAHHLMNFSSNPELRFSIDNGITLSRSSHKEFHRIYGKYNNTKEQMEKFLSRKEK